MSVPVYKVRSGVYESETFYLKKEWWHKLIFWKKFNYFSDIKDGYKFVYHESKLPKKNINKIKLEWNGKITELPPNL